MFENEKIFLDVHFLITFTVDTNISFNVAQWRDPKAYSLILLILNDFKQYLNSIIERNVYI